MSTREHELASLREEFENREAGVAELMELYEKVEDIYVHAAATIPEGEVISTSDSTSMVMADAYLGQDSN